MNKHKLKKRKRHQRQIEEGVRSPKKKEKRSTPRVKMPKRMVKLSEVDPGMVQKVIQAVSTLDM